jgi:hypothetical protein
MRKARPKPPSAIDLLKQDHAYVKQAYRNFEKMDQEDLPAVQALVREVCTALEVHARVEEAIFYPPCARPSTRTISWRKPRSSTSPQRP